MRLLAAEVVEHVEMSLDSSSHPNVKLFSVPERHSNLIEFQVRVGTSSTASPHHHHHHHNHGCTVRGFAQWDKDARRVQIVAYKRPFDAVVINEMAVTTNSLADAIEQFVRRDINLTLAEIGRTRASLERTMEKLRWMKRIKHNGVTNIRVDSATEVEVADDETGRMIAYEFATHFDIRRSNGDLVPSVGRLIVFFDDEDETKMVGSQFEILAIDDQPFFIAFEPQSDCDSVTKIFDSRGHCLQPTMRLLRSKREEKTEELWAFADLQTFLSECGLW